MSAKSIRGLLRRLYKNGNTVTVVREDPNSPAGGASGLVAGTILAVHETFVVIRSSTDSSNHAIPYEEITDVRY